MDTEVSGNGYCRVVNNSIHENICQNAFTMGTYITWKSLLSKIKLWKVYFRGKLFLRIEN